MPILVALLASITVPAPQAVAAVVSDPASYVAGIVRKVPVERPAPDETRVQDDIPQMPGWPVTTGRHANFVPTRGAVMADLDGDKKLEILVPSTLGALHAWKLDGTPVPGFPVNTTGFPQYPPSVADLDGDGQIEIVQTTRGFTSGGRLYVFNAQGQVLAGWPKSLNNNNVEYSAALADLDNDGKLEIIVSERMSSAGRVHVFEKDGTEWGGNWPVTIDHVPAQSCAVADVDGDGDKEVFTASYNSLYLIRRNGTVMSGWPKQIPGANFSYQCAALADLDHDGKLDIVVGAHKDAPGTYAFKYDGTMLPGWPKLMQTWSYGCPTVTDLENDGTLDVLDGQAGYVSGSSNLFWTWTATGQTRAGFPYVSTHGGGAEGPYTVADVDGDGVQEIFADHNMMVSNQGYLYGMTATGQDLPGFPLRTTGFTYMNGATIGDVDGDGDYELAVVASDTVVTIYLYTLPWQYKTSGLEWPTYHARNVRDGLFAPVAKLVPDAFRITRGILVSGDLASLATADGNSLNVRKGVATGQNDFPVTIEFDSTSPSVLPSTLESDVTFHVSNIGLKYVVDLYDFSAGAWDTVDAKTGTAPQSDTTVTVKATNPARYVEAGTKRVRARLRVKVATVAVTSSFTVSTDAVGWRLQ
ncbi:MAG: VCBS repeat-containing protein [Armatimonadetes bacterium]|nr:VCBS repeat-containing protein [Armatimonadota bacterium]